MKKISSFLFSMFFTGILIVAFAVSIGYATFIENDFGTITAKILVYNAFWFEILLVVLSVNLIGSIFVNKLVSKKKWPMFLFHIAFVVIIIGAGITRYFGYEGMMHIREGDRSNTIVSTESYVTIKATQGDHTVISENEVKFSPYTANRFSDKINFNGQTIKIRNVQFVPSAKESIVPDPSGGPMIAMVAVDNNMQPTEFILETGSVRKFGDKSLAFGDRPADVRFSVTDGMLFLTSTDTVYVSDMMSQEAEGTVPGTKLAVSTQKVYTVGTLNFLVQHFYAFAKKQLAYTTPQQHMQLPDALQLNISVGNESKDLIVYGSKGTIGEPVSTEIAGITLTATYGSKLIELPFALHLTDFQLERYPGSNSPSSYASEVILIDGEKQEPHRIFMNNILKYRGYRFFQSSYDSDEKGTILSVNSDAPGTGVTYFGYLIMTLGMLMTLFNRSSRFKALIKGSARLHKQRKKLFAVVILGVVFAFNANAQASGLDKDHVSDFGELIIQSPQGRIEPVNTLASQILRKVAKKTGWEGMSPTEVFLDMQVDPEKWKNVAIIKVGNPELRRQLGIHSGKYATFNTIVAPREMGGYRLSNLVQQAYAKSTNERNKFDKEVIYVDERVNILMNVFSGNFLTVFPVPGDDNHKWVSVSDLHLLPADQINPTRQMLTNYYTSVKNNDWATAGALLADIKAKQKEYSEEVLPSPTKVKLEVLYNNVNIFGKLSKIFMFTGLILLFIMLTTVFNPSIKLTAVKKLAFVFILLLFVAETVGLGVRWYISGHAPWSNGYESMIFISWATCLGGLLFAKRSEITLSLTTVLAGLTLMVAGMSWMSPEITNLVPVLKSYWLIVHVAIITASYGFLGISALLGLLNLILMVFRTKSNADRVNFTIKELVYIINIALIIGLFMLTVGSFLGGVWANESWGRYWGWDPKETWALVTILVYTFIVHMHKIPGFKGSFAMSTAALVGFSSVLMTYFGVNYYLSGLHSYAQGEAAPIPTGVYVAVLIVIVVILAAYFSEKTRLQKQDADIDEIDV